MRRYVALLAMCASLMSCGKSEGEIRAEERAKVLEEQLAASRSSEAPTCHRGGPQKPVRAPAGVDQRSADVSSRSSLVGSYDAFIGREDLYNSAGTLLTDPAAILRQERANFHRFGVQQAGDTSDPFFDDAGNRATMERMVASGLITPEAKRLIQAGGATIHVDIYGRNGRGDYLSIDVNGAVSPMRTALHMVHLGL